MIKPVIAPFVETALREMTAPKSLQVYVANYALATLAETQVVNRSALGYLPAVITRVDGRTAAATLAALATVKLAKGVIEFAFEDKGQEDILRWIAEALDTRSPSGPTGRYGSSHITLADGVPFDVEQPAPAAREFVFVNGQPYARKIETGSSSQAPDGVYQVTATLARQRFASRPVKIGFAYRALSSGDVAEWASSVSASRHAANTRGGSESAQQHWLQRQPAITVTMLRN